jgi:hypothetical protein
MIMDEGDPMEGEWQSAIKAVVPSLGNLLSTPLRGMALKAITDAVLTSDARRDNIEEAIQRAISKSSPDVLLKLKQAENDFKLVMEGAQISAPEVPQASSSPALVPADGAPKVTSQSDPTDRDHTSRNLAYAYTIGYFVLLLIILFHGVEEKAQALINTLVGVLTASQVGIMTYYFGSSAGSAKKTDLLSQRPPS